MVAMNAIAGITFEYQGQLSATFGRKTYPYIAIYTEHAFGRRQIKNGTDIGKAPYGCGLRS